MKFNLYSRLSIVLIFFLFASAFSQLSLFKQSSKTDNINNRFSPPAGYERITIAENSFATYLRNLALLPDSSAVLDYKDRIKVKANDSTLAAVIAMDISGKNLYQCMDIIIALYVDWLFKQKKQSKINLPLPEGTFLSWQQWKNGYRDYFKGLKYYLSKTAAPDSSARNFQKYLNRIFELSGTQTFYHYAQKIDLSDIQPGDFITKKGNNGHAVLILDIAENHRGDKVALIAQGDTPACQMYILKASSQTAWFKLDPQTTYPELPIRKKMYWKGLRRFK